MRSLCTCAWAALFLLGAGCGQKVNVEKSVTLEPGTMLAPIVLDGPKSEQKINVEFSADNPIDVYVILGKDEKAILAQLESPKKLDIRASKKNSKGDTLAATIPAGSDYGVYLANATKKTAVKVSVKTP